MCPRVCVCVCVCAQGKQNQDPLIKNGKTRKLLHSATRGQRLHRVSLSLVHIVQLSKDVIYGYHLCLDEETESQLGKRGSKSVFVVL